MNNPTLEALGIKDGQALQHKGVSIQECLNCVIQGKPLPAGATTDNTPVYNSHLVQDGKIMDELTHVERMRQNVENIVADVQAIERAKQVAKRREAIAAKQVKADPATSQTTTESDGNKKA